MRQCLTNLDVRQQALKSRVLGHRLTDNTTHHRVLAHDHDGATTKGGADLGHLLGANMVGVHNQHALVLRQKVSEAGAVFDLAVGVYTFRHDVEC